LSISYSYFLFYYYNSKAERLQSADVYVFDTRFHIEGKLWNIPVLLYGYWACLNYYTVYCSNKNSLFAVPLNNIDLWNMTDIIEQFKALEEFVLKRIEIEFLVI